ncbi:kelch domain-containing protein 1 isoform X3 [Rhineura floridana]|uniref:kelch domain-containing protein 1 isoform X3 n=1 Tax=Rhineura floridana TaxID=261503 RepID=UPI002AC86762|nr:kelch domain-containing protein 1 isoform X3 [Rhineura floridana]
MGEKRRRPPRPPPEQSLRRVWLASRATMGGKEIRERATPGRGLFIINAVADWLLVARAQPLASFPPPSLTLASLNLRSIEENEVYLPNDELWIYDIDCGLWSMHLMEGELPPSMSGSCGACINGMLYIFGGFDDKGYSNRLYYVNLRTRNGTYLWEKITDFKGQPPTPRDKLACWVYKDRLIYFGGYGCRKQSELSDCFDVHDAFWEGQIFWGWHNDVHVFDTTTQTWYQPTIKSGVPPQPRAAHSCAVLGNKGYVFGGRVLQTRMNDLHSLNLDTWIWSGQICTNGEKPEDRSWHTLTPVTDGKLFLFGGLSSDNVPLSDGWIYGVATNKWQQLTYLPKSRPRLWHTACLGKEGEVMVFGGSKDDLHFLDTGSDFCVGKV